jgi:hypothetical protein
MQQQLRYEYRRRLLVKRGERIKYNCPLPKSCHDIHHQSRSGDEPSGPPAGKWQYLFPVSEAAKSNYKVGTDADIHV